jgi:hypothetical protein
MLLPPAVAVVVLAMRACPEHRNDPVPVGHVNFEAIGIPANIEDHDIAAQEAG